MSKLYKELKYDTDRVMQPGDPLTSANGKNEIVLRDDGVATIHHLPTYYLIEDAPNMGGGVAKLYFRSIESVDEIESGLDEIHAEVEVLFGSSSSLPSFSRRELTFTRNQGSGAGDYMCDLSSLSSGYFMYLYGSWCGGSTSYDGIGYQAGNTFFCWETTGGHTFKDLYTDENSFDIVVDGGFFCSENKNTKLKITDDNGAILYKKSFGGPVVHLKAGWNVGGYTTAVDQDIEFKGPFVGGGPAEYYYVPVDYAGSTGDEDFLTNAWEDGPFLIWRLNGGGMEFTYGQYGAKEIKSFNVADMDNEEVVPLTSSNVSTGQFSITRSMSYSPAILATTDQLLQIGTTATTAAAGNHTHTFPNSFGTVSVGGSSVVADSVNDTLTISACSGVSVYANPSTDTINIALDTDTYNRIPPCGGYMEKVWANAGGAAEVAAGCISIYGSSGVTTSASGGTLTISLDSNACTKINGAVQGVALENAGGNLDLVDSNTKVATIPVMFRRVSFTSKTSSGQYCSGIIVPVNGEWDSDGSYNGTLEILACNGVIVYEYGSNGLEFDVAGDVPRTINTDGGSAYPSYNELNINGCNGISTSQLNNGNTIYVNLDAFFNTDSGSIGFSSGCVDIHGCNGIRTTTCNGAMVVSLDEAAVKYSLLTTQLSLSTVSAPNDTAEATLVDHAINIVELPASVETVTFTFPVMIQGKARDFMIRLIIAGEVPTIYFQEPGGGSITFDADGETWTNIQSGANLIMFTETKQTQA